MATMRACDVGAQDQLIVLDWGISWVIPPQGGGAQVLDGKRPHWLESVTVQLVSTPAHQASRDGTYTTRPSDGVHAGQLLLPWSSSGHSNRTSNGTVVNRPHPSHLTRRRGARTRRLFMSGVDDPRSQLLGKSTAGEPARADEKGANAVRSRTSYTRLKARAVAAQERHAGRRAAEVEREHTESRARLAARFYFYSSRRFAVRQCRSATASRGGVPPWGGDTRRRRQTYKDATNSPGRERESYSGSGRVGGERDHRIRRAID